MHIQGRAEEACLTTKNAPTESMYGLHLSLSFYHIPRNGEEKAAQILKTSRRDMTKALEKMPTSQSHQEKQMDTKWLARAGWELE